MENIDEFERQYLKKVRKTDFRRTLSWAASFLIIVPLGIVGYFLVKEKEKTYQFTSTDNIQSDDARTILSTGEEIALKKDNSTIALNDETNQVTVNDSIIDLKENRGAGKQTIQMNEVVIPYGKKIRTAVGRWHESVAQRRKPDGVSFKIYKKYSGSFLRGRSPF